LKEGKPVALAVKTGMADNSGYEMLEGALKEGDEVIVEQMGGTAKKKASSSSPMGPRF
jgi:HlyD family secretion protein